MISTLILLFTSFFVFAQNTPGECPDQLSGSELQNYFSENPAPLVERARREGPQCVSRVAKTFAYYVAQLQGRRCSGDDCNPWNQNFIGECAQGTTPEACSSAKASQELQRNNFRRFVAASLSPQQLSEEEIDRMCLMITPENPLELIRRAGISEILRELDCSELPVGQTRNITTEIGENTSHYQLVREGAQNYRLNVPILFQGENSLTPNEMSAFQQRAQGCLDQYNGAMLGPNGERLTIGIIDQLPGNVKNVVLIHRTFPRANSRNYSFDISCSTVVHEVLHLTGLVDEYRESDRTLDYSCRIHSEGASIMANNDLATNSLSSEISCSVQAAYQSLWRNLGERERSLLLSPQIGEVLNRASFCTPRAESERLTLPEALARESLAMRELERSPNTLSFEVFVPVFDEQTSSAWMEKRTVDCRCPEGTVTKCHSWIASPPTRNFDLTNTREECPPFMSGERRAIGATENTTELNANGMIIRKQGRSPSLLSPNHFNRILAGSCERRAQDYNVCASWAYTSECGPAQNTCFDGPDVCSGPPAQCTSDRLLGRVQGQ